MKASKSHLHVPAIHPAASDKLMQVARVLVGIIQVGASCGRSVLSSVRWRHSPGRCGLQAPLSCAGCSVPDISPCIASPPLRRPLAALPLQIIHYPGEKAWQGVTHSNRIETTRQVFTSAWLSQGEAVDSAACPAPHVPLRPCLPPRRRLAKVPRSGSSIKPSVLRSMHPALALNSPDHPAPALPGWQSTTRPHATPPATC